MEHSPESLVILRAIAEARDLLTVMRVVGSAGRRLVGADGIAFVLRENGYCYYADEDAISPLWKGQRFPIDRCVFGWVIQRGTPAVIPDVFDDARVAVELFRTTFVKSLAIVPVGVSQPLAAIGACWATPHQPSDAELTQLQRLAQAAAAVLEQTCPRCARRGYVQAERVIAKGVASRQSYCGACEHSWVTW